MPIIKSAKKRVRTARKAAIRNSKTKRSLKLSLKQFRAAISGSTGANNLAESYAGAQSQLDKAAKKNIIHPNKAARQKARLARAAKAAALSQAAENRGDKKQAARTKKIAAGASKAASKATGAKKTAAKKTAAKK